MNTTGGAPATAGQSGGGSLAAAGSAGSGGMAGGAAALDLALFNVVTGAVEPGYERIGETLERVELPPRFTLQANVAAGVASVRFTLNGTERIDSMPPFLLNEGADGNAAPWQVTFGKHELKIETFAQTDAQGPISSASGTLELRGTGMNTDSVKSDAAAHEQWLDENLDAVMVAGTFQGTAGSIPYRLFTPEKYDASVAYPLVVFLHGRGDRGSDNRPGIYGSQLFHGPQSIVSPNSQFEFPSFVLVPQCSNIPDNHEWARWVGGLGGDGSYDQAPEPWPSALLVKELVESLLDTQSIEEDRIYLTGESMGGFGTWEFTTRWPALFAAGVPMAGYSDPNQVAKILDIPFWVFHGDADQANPVAGSRNMTAALQAAGGSVKYTEYAGVDHGGTFRRAWTEETELLPWIFSQRRAL